MKLNLKEHMYVCMFVVDPFNFYHWIDLEEKHLYYSYISQQWIFRFPFAIAAMRHPIRFYSYRAKQFSQMNGFFMVLASVSAAAPVRRSWPWSIHRLANKNAILVNYWRAQRRWWRDVGCTVPYPLRTADPNGDWAIKYSWNPTIFKGKKSQKWGNRQLAVLWGLVTFACPE